MTRIITILRKHYSTSEFKEANGESVFRILISCILSLRTKDETTYPAADRLFAKAKTPKEMLQLSEKQIQELIFPVGFYITKSKTIRNISKALIENYGGKVPDTEEELLKLKGVGRKTANLVLAFGYNKPAIVVDVHVNRISNRLGWVKTKHPHETEFALMKLLPKKYWIDINELLVRHGQNICKPISPKCSECPIKTYCRRVNVTTSR